VRTRPDARGFTLVEILVVMAVIAILAAVSIPLLLDVQMAGREASAIASLRTIHSAQEAFRVACGDGKRFASTLPQLGAAGTITKDLSDAPVVMKSGYVITMVGPEPLDKDHCTGEPMVLHWYASAVPQLPGRTGKRAFATASGEDIWTDTTGVAPPEPFKAAETVWRLENGK
jgi:prepilin-type N-terminal cleavage/methylation domain-containing protein